MFELDLPRAERLRSYIDSKVHDKSVAEKLKPWYGGWCKRPTFHDHYLDTFNQENVTLVDTNGKGIDRYSENGLVANGEEYEVDLIVFATGFTVPGHKGGCPSQQTRAPVIGRDGRVLEEKWLGKDFATLFGSATNGFPNYFFPGVSIVPLKMRQIPWSAETVQLT
jgi:cation diffusion facilitator CzcD-associated flavoprotein CzcO